MICDFWSHGRRCGKPAVEELVWLNPNIDSGSTQACADCLKQAIATVTGEPSHGR